MSSRSPTWSSRRVWRDRCMMTNSLNKQRISRRSRWVMWIRWRRNYAKWKRKSMIFGKDLMNAGSSKFTSHWMLDSLILLELYFIMMRKVLLQLIIKVRSKSGIMMENRIPSLCKSYLHMMIVSMTWSCSAMVT